MPQSNPTRKPGNRRAALSTASIISFSLTLLGGSVAVLLGAVPLETLSFGERADVGTILFLAPVLALVLGVVFEAARIALKHDQLPEPRRRGAVLNWSPGGR